MTKTEIRRALKVPKGIRIAQHVYNLFRDCENSLAVMVLEKGKPMYTREMLGIDMFYVEDEEFIRKINEENPYAENERE